MAVSISHNQNIDLTAFRKRVLLLQSWRYAGYGGCIGCILAILAIIGDRLDLFDLKPAVLVVLVMAGSLAGVFYSFTRKYTDSQIARSIDRRSSLEDRLTTIYETDHSAPSQDGFLEAVATDTEPRVGHLNPAELFPIRFNKVHGALVGLALLCVLFYVLFETTLLSPLTTKLEATQLKQQAIQIQQVARPFLENADKPGASSEDKQLAHDIRRLTHDMSKGRLSKQEALIRANQLAQQAQQLEAKRNLALSKSVMDAQNAGAKLQQMEQNESMQKTDSAKLADQASDVQKKLDALQNQLNAAKAAQGGKSSLSKQQQASLKSQISALQKQLQEIKLSQQALDTFNKLASNPDYQEAMQLLSKLQQSTSSSSNQQQLTPEQLKAIADRLEALAKSLNTDAKMKAYAKALLEAARQARLGNQAGMGVAIANAMGMSAPAGGTSSSDPDMGKGAATEDTWTGDHGHINQSKKSTLLHLNFQDRVITSQKGAGPESYSEELGPAQLTNKSDIPYEVMLPKYEKSAESTLSKGDIPPEMRTKVRNYFDSLHQQQ